MSISSVSSFLSKTVLRGSGRCVSALAGVGVAMMWRSALSPLTDMASGRVLRCLSVVYASYSSLYNVSSFNSPAVILGGLAAEMHPAPLTTKDKFTELSCGFILLAIAYLLKAVQEGCQNNIGIFLVNGVSLLLIIGSMLFG